MSLQPFWRLSGLRALLTSATNQLRTFSSSHAAKGCSLDPVKRRAQMDRHNEIKRLRRQSDPDWLRRERQTVRNSVRRAKWRETNRETVLEYLREFCKQRYAHDPRHKLRKRMHDLAMAHAWFREKLPWKSHVPIRYDEKVQHSCEKCIVTRFGGFKLWWKQRQSVDGKQGVGSRQEQGQEDEKYLCTGCYVTGPEALPEGYEDVTIALAEIKARAKELGHSLEK